MMHSDLSFGSLQKNRIALNKTVERRVENVSLFNYI